MNRTLRGGEAEDALAETPATADGFAEPDVQLDPGERFILRGLGYRIQMIEEMGQTAPLDPGVIPGLCDVLALPDPETA